jgi:hypothetical protein
MPEEVLLVFVRETLMAAPYQRVVVFVGEALALGESREGEVAALGVDGATTSAGGAADSVSKRTMGTNAPTSRVRATSTEAIRAGRASRRRTA